MEPSAHGCMSSGRAYWVGSGPWFALARRATLSPGRLTATCCTSARAPASKFKTVAFGEINQPPRTAVAFLLTQPGRRERVPTASQPSTALSLARTPPGGCALWFKALGSRFGHDPYGSDRTPIGNSPTL